MTYGLSNGHVTDDVTWPQRCCGTVRSAILATAWLLVHLSTNHHVKLQAVSDDENRLSSAYRLRY